MRVTDVENYTVSTSEAQQRIDNLLLSPSSVSTFQCNRRWYLKYLAGIKGPDSNASIVGSVVHSVLEDFMKLDPNLRTIVNLRTMSIQTARKVSSEREHDEKVAEKFASIVQEKSTSLFKVETPKDVFVFSTEREMSCEIEGIQVTGVIDRISEYKGRKTVDDYKTGAFKKKYMDQPKEQITLYALMLEKLEGIAPTHGSIIYLGGKRPNKYVFAFTDSLKEKTIASLTKVAKEIESLGIEESNYTPNTTALCGYCPYATEALCPTGAAKREDYIQKIS